MLRRMRGSALFFVCIFGLTLGVSLPLLADTSTDTGTFKTSGQNMWGTSGSPNTFGTSENAGVGLAAGFNTTVGDCNIACAQAQGGLAGNMGVAVDGQVHGGTVGATIDFNSVINTPHTFQHDTTLDASMSLSLVNTTLKADGAQLTGGTSINGSLGAYAQIGGCVTGSCAGAGVILAGSPLNPPPGSPVPPIPASFSQTLFNLSGNLAALSGSGTHSAAAGASTTAGINVDLGASIAGALGVSGSGNWNLPGFPISLSGSFTAFSGSGNFSTTFDQNLAFDPTVTGDLYVEQTGQTALCYSNGTCDAIQTPHTGNVLTLLPQYFATGSLKNDTKVSFGAGFSVDLLSGDVNVDGNDATFGPLATFGDSQISLPGTTLLDSQFTLGGFQKIDGKEINLYLQPTSAPEPGSLALLLSGLIGTISTVRHRAKRRG